MLSRLVSRPTSEREKSCKSRRIIQRLTQEHSTDTKFATTEMGNTKKRGYFLEAVDVMKGISEIVHHLCFLSGCSISFRFLDIKCMYCLRTGIYYSDIHILETGSFRCFHLTIMHIQLGPNVSRLHMFHSYDANWFLEI